MSKIWPARARLNQVREGPRTGIVVLQQEHAVPVLGEDSSPRSAAQAGSPPVPRRIRFSIPSEPVFAIAGCLFVNSLRSDKSKTVPGETQAPATKAATPELPSLADFQPFSISAFSSKTPPRCRRARSIKSDFLDLRAQARVELDRTKSIRIHLQSFLGPHRPVAGRTNS